jgi:uncharacterized membrane protein YccC
MVTGNFLLVVWVKNAVYSQYFVDALRTALTIVLPAALFFVLGLRDPAIGTGLGALLVSLCDLPGDIREKAQGLTVSSMVLAAVALITSAALSSQVGLGILILICCFGFSYVSIYGNRALNTGSLALIMMIFTIGLHPLGLSFSLYILAGGIWYMFSAVLYLKVCPFRPARHALGDCVAEIAIFLRNKATFYDLAVPLNDCYRAAISGHIKVSEKQEFVRRLLLKESLITRQSVQTGARLVRLASEVIDLYEQILAIHYDYEFIRTTLSDLKVLDTVNLLIKRMADDLSEMAVLIRQNRNPETDILVLERLPLFQLRLKSAEISAKGLQAALMKKIIANFKVIDQKAQSIKTILAQSGGALAEISNKDAFRFVSKPVFSLKLVRENFNFHSAIFRFSIRVSLMCFCAYLCSLYLFHDKYDYWLLLTIVIIARPGFSTTKKRSFQRLVGTALGIAFSFMLLFFVHSPYVVIVLLPLLLLGYLSFLYTWYLISVCFITALAVLGLELLGGNDRDLLLDRSYFTLLGGVIALGAAFIFPFWESRKMSDLLKEILSANIRYLHKLLDYVSGGPFDVIEYKLARKQIFVSSANLSRAYQHMLSEPKNSPLLNEYIYRFQIFNHGLYGSVAALLLDGATNRKLKGLTEHRQLVEQSITFLEDAVRKLSADAGIPAPTDEEIKPVEGSMHMEIAGRQLKLIRQLAKNIYLQTNQIVYEQNC